MEIVKTKISLFIKSAPLILFSLIFLSPHSLFAKDNYKIGVLAYKGKEQAMKRWESHGEYLNRLLSPMTFSIVPLSYKNEELTKAVIGKEIDFVITNPGQYTELELQGYVSQLATRRVKGPLGVLDVFGGTAITLKNEKSPSLYQDIKNKKIAIPSKHSLGGWQVHLREGLRQNNDLIKNNEIIELKNHIKVVDAVLAGQVDIGFIRSDLLETLQNQGKPGLDKLSIIDSRSYPDYPYALSTALYPEWPFAMLVDTSKVAATEVVKALFGMWSSDKAAIDAGIEGWAIPGNYSEVNDLFREIGIGPYQKKKLTLIDFIKHYYLEFIILILGIFTLIISLSNRALKAEYELGKETLHRETAEKHIKVQAELLAKVAHEFRTPLHAILNFARIGKRKSSDDKLKEYFNKIDQSGSRALNLTNDLLDLSKLEAGKMEIFISSNEINQSISVAVNELSGMAEEKKITIANKCRDNIFAEYDAKLIIQVLINLLSNAIKFSPEGGLITINASVSRTELSMSVSDTGVGIPTEQIEKIFDKFSRSSETLAYKGTGLGLPICREIIELHHGKIYAQSPPDNQSIGSVFHIQIPQ